MTAARRLRVKIRAGGLLAEMKVWQKPGDAGGVARKSNGRSRRPSLPTLRDLDATKVSDQGLGIDQ